MFEDATPMDGTRAISFAGECLELDPNSIRADQGYSPWIPRMGLGLITYLGGLSFDGAFYLGGMHSSLGQITWANGTTYLGDASVDSRLAAPGPGAGDDNRLGELSSHTQDAYGQFSAQGLHGWGATFARDGRLLRQGRWDSGHLVQAM